MFSGAPSSCSPRWRVPVAAAGTIATPGYSTRCRRRARAGMDREPRHARGSSPCTRLRSLREAVLVAIAVRRRAGGGDAARLRLGGALAAANSACSRRGGDRPSFVRSPHVSSRRRARRRRGGAHGRRPDRARGRTTHCRAAGRSCASSTTGRRHDPRAEARSATRAAPTPSSPSSTRDRAAAPSDDSRTRPRDRHAELTRHRRAFDNAIARSSRRSARCGVGGARARRRGAEADGGEALADATVAQAAHRRGPVLLSRSGQSRRATRPGRATRRGTGSRPARGSARASRMTALSEAMGASRRRGPTASIVRTIARSLPDDLLALTPREAAGAGGRPRLRRRRQEVRAIARRSPSRRAARRAHRGASARSTAAADDGDAVRASRAGARVESLARRWRGRGGEREQTGWWRASAATEASAARQRWAERRRRRGVAGECSPRSTGSSRSSRHAGADAGPRPVRRPTAADVPGGERRGGERGGR